MSRERFNIILQPSPPEICPDFMDKEGKRSIKLRTLAPITLRDYGDRTSISWSCNYYESCYNEECTYRKKDRGDNGAIQHLR